MWAFTVTTDDLATVAACAAFWLCGLLLGAGWGAFSEEKRWKRGAASGVLVEVRGAGGEATAYRVSRVAERADA